MKIPYHEYIYVLIKFAVFFFYTLVYYTAGLVCCFLSLTCISQTVWCAIFVAFISASLMLYTVSRVNSDRQARYAYNLRESFWYMWGTLLRGSLCGRYLRIFAFFVACSCFMLLC